MDLNMRLKRLPIEKSFPILNRIKENFNHSIETKSLIKTKDQVKYDMDMDKSYDLDKDEYDLLINKWSKGKNKNIPPQPIHEIFKEQVIKNPDKIALTFNERSLSYRELDQKSNQVARYLVDLKIEKESLITVFLKRSIESVIIALGILKAGATYVPIDPGYPEERVLKILTNSKSKIIFTENSLKKNIPNSFLSNVVLFDEERKLISDYDFSDLEVNVNQNQLAYIIYTSGSTGLPKGVQIEHRSLVNFIYSIVEEYGINKNDNVLQFFSLGFDVSIFDMFVTFCTGASLIMASENERVSPELLTKLMKEKKVTLAELPPALLPLLKSDDFPDLRLISVGGERFSGELINEWATPQRKFFNGYGPTETTVVVTLYECRGGGWNGNPPIGKPIHNVEAYVLNNKMEPVPIGVPGELHIGGESLARGYLYNDDITNEKFINHPFVKGEKLYKTGDLVKWNPDGQLEILGRVDRQVKIRGYRVELGDIERAILEESNINQVVVQMLEYEDGNKQLIAYVVAVDSRDVDLGEIRENLKIKLPKYMLPAKIIDIPKIPLTSHGKIDFEALPVPDESRPNDDYVEPRNEIELKLCNEIFSPILGINRIGIKDNFFDLGGNSLQATLVVSNIRNIFGIEINLIDFFQSPVVETLGEQIKLREANTLDMKMDVLKEIKEIEQSWIKVHQAPEAKIRIVCFPYAGSSTYFFRKWSELLAPDIEVVTIELPGRDQKIKEKAFSSALDIGMRLSSELAKLNDKPLVFVGQSGGALLAFETSRLLLERGIKIERLFALASRAPHKELSEPSRYHLPDHEFLERVNEFGGLSKEFLNNIDLLKLMIPTMRADEESTETYFYTGELGVFPFPISVLGGKEDRITKEILEKWFELTSEEGDIEFFEGGHFFLQEHEDTVLYSIIEKIMSSVRV
ncbi:amino acid adenylation domain-containing protein [Bacillus cereus]|uniref:amino acid adenylation domain-containing protein n=1 Tax=Bacillus cereus TaxID=1396 RepID=UPI001374C1D0|nr:amino acid adenylation domain-containing protein [Bacillus cereus]